MRRMNVSENTGVIFRKDRAASKPLGSCFIFRYPETLLTAAHCVKGLRATDLRITLPFSRASGAFDVVDLQAHSEADVAVLRIEGIDEHDITWPQTQLFDDRLFGEQFGVFGYPEDPFAGSGEAAVTPRYFNGYIQRFMRHRSKMGYMYLAAELSIACPRGLSGSAVFNARHHGRLYGLITENVEYATEISSFVDVDEGGVQSRETIRDRILYGVSLWLPEVAGWVDELIPPVSKDEANRRAENQIKWRDQ